MAAQEEAESGWLDDADEDALDSFMQEDALLEAIQNAPGLETQGLQADVNTSVSSTCAASSSGNVNLSSGTECSEMLLKERRTETDVHRPGGKPQPLEVDAPESSKGDKEKGRPKQMPWRGWIAALSFVLGVLLWGPDMWGEPAAMPVNPVPPPTPRPIQMPLADEEEGEGTAAPVATNASRLAGDFGVKKGRISVTWSTDSNSTAAALAAAASKDNDTAARGEHGRRGRGGRVRGGKTELA